MVSATPPILPRGMRDYNAAQVQRRRYICTHMQRVFENYGFLPLETPAIEQSALLQGKYGEGAEPLMFYVLDSGDYLEKLRNQQTALDTLTSTSARPLLCSRALRYDLTVPLARYVSAEQHALAFPFKRYQMQPVWRADRPQKGRYREFYQCDVDIVGTKSLFCEAEMIMLVQEVFTALGIEEYMLRINHRQILQALAHTLGIPREKTSSFFLTLDKQDKISEEALYAALSNQGLSAEALARLTPLLRLQGNLEEVFKQLEPDLQAATTPGFSALRETLHHAKALGSDDKKICFDMSLVRGLHYYTGLVLEVQSEAHPIGSLVGGGRYDELTDLFGLSAMSGMGISFGLDRIYAVMDAVHSFPSGVESTSQVLVIHFDDPSRAYALGLLTALRRAGIRAEMYPEAVKIKKQFAYAVKKKIPHVLWAGEAEQARGSYVLKDIVTGKQEDYTREALLKKWGKR